MTIKRMSLNRNPSHHGLGSTQRTDTNDRRLEVPTDPGTHLPPSYDPRVLDWAADHPAAPGSARASSDSSNVGPGATD